VLDQGPIATPFFKPLDSAVVDAPGSAGGAVTSSLRVDPAGIYVIEVPLLAVPR